ncbi:MAG: biopolymer transporter Tol [Ignavibacteriaceae bacterium]|nr:biopolymer transporter Tol [Ignavibacteriaceae bacterium]
MMKILHIKQGLLLSILFHSLLFGQFGQNKVQYKEFEWIYIQSQHFDVYFSPEGAKIAEFAAKAAEDALAQIESKLNFKINNRITFILYNSQNDFQETNVTDEYLSEGIGGFTELFKNRVVVPFTGSYKQFRHVIHHELVHAVINDMFYGGSIQNIISNNISIRLPLWFNEGLAEYLSLGWDTDTDMFIRDAANSEYLPNIPQLDGYFAYRGGQSVFNYIARKYGEEKVGELVNRVKSKGSFEEGLQATLGLKFEEFNERWRKDVKREFWPDIAKYKDPDEFAKRLTDPRKDGGFYNTSPAISPDGRQIAFISNRDFFFDVYLMEVSDPKNVRRIVKGNRSADFEELNILTPGLTWSPDNKSIALGAKSSGYDVIYIIDAETGDTEVLPHKFAGVASIHWSPDSVHLAISAHSADQSDIYLYNLNTNQLTNLTSDIYTDNDPHWSSDGRYVFFVSDRGNDVSTGNGNSLKERTGFQNDVYAIEVSSKQIFRLTGYTLSDESSPVPSPDGTHLLYVSDKNGINNVYKKKVAFTNDSSYVSEEGSPLTNSMNGIYQLSLSADSKKLVFSSMYQASYNIFSMNNPFELQTDLTKLEPTNYMAELKGIRVRPAEKEKIEFEDSSEIKKDDVKIVTGQVVDSTTAGDSLRIDTSSIIFGENTYFKPDSVQKENKNFQLTDNLDADGNYRVNKYKITFSPDIVYANAGYSTFYGLLGTTVISFSDVLGNHRLIGQTSLQIDLKNSDYGLAYYYLPNRMDIGIEAFHTARFVYLERFGTALNLFRFRNYGMSTSFSYPLSRYYRFDGGLSLLNVTSENLDNLFEESQKRTFLIPSFSFVHDNTIFGYTAPIEGTRYRFETFGNALSLDKYSFFSVTADYRNYIRFWTDYSIALRFSGAYSDGKNPQRFFLGGLENWINRQFATGELPVESPSDFAFLTGALPLRGYNYAEKIGTRYTLFNFEYRFPLIRYLLTGALPILFRNVQGVAFFDAGTAWSKERNLQLFTKDAGGETITKDLLMGTGVGARMYFLYFLTRFDVAWAYDVKGFSEPKFYFSLGADF